LKKFFIIFLTVAVLLLLAVPVSSTFSSSSPVIKVEFPSPVGNLLGTLPVKIVIPDPNSFGYPRIPVEISIALVEFREHKVVIPLLEEVDLTNPLTLKRFLDTPIEKVVEFPLPVHEVGSYHLVVDVKCLYGPAYKWTFWYSYTVNSLLEIVPERLHFVGLVDRNLYGYTFSQAQKYDFLGKGYSFRIQVEVVSPIEEVLYIEPAAVFGTFFDSPTPLQIQNELEVTKEDYYFLLAGYPTAHLKVSWVPIGNGDWRWLFSNQPLSWVEKNGIIISTLDSHWSWNPQGEFQLEYIGD